MLNTKQREVEIAKQLLSIKAVFLNPSKPFIWASGIKSPIYCDNRLTLSYPEIRNSIEFGLAELIKMEYPECEAVFGTSTAGIAHAALVANLLKLPMGYVRSSNKSHGRENKIEGVAPTGKKVVVIEDLISTGGSVIEVVEALREIGAEVLGIASIFTYGLKKGVEKLKAANIKNLSLSNFKTLCGVAFEEGYINQREYNMVLAFQSNPDDDAWTRVKL